MGLQGHSWWMDILRGIFGFLDKLVYGLIKWILYGIFDLSSISTNSDVFSGIYGRIYVILGIFMAFKLSFSFFQYIIDPESMNGKSDKGVSKLFMRVFIMLFALMVLPSLLFGQNGSKGILSRAQDAFLPVLPRLIFGTESVGGTNSGSGVTTTVEQTASELSIVTLKGFFAPTKEIDSVCGAGTYDNTPEIETMEDFERNLKTTCTVKGTGFLGIGATKYYKYSYMPFVSTVVGVLIAALLLGITIDIAKRLFKMIILEVIAPVPIMSLIDPKGSKDGAFSHWVKNLTSTFLDIFIKLGLVYLIIVLIHMIVNANDSNGLFTNFPSFQEDGFRGAYLTILLILGLIFFAKEAPKFIKDSLGLKDNGGGLFDDVKTLGKAAGLVGGAAGIIGSGIASGRANYLSDAANGKQHTPARIAKNIGAGLLGAGAGAGTAIKAATAKDASFNSILKAQAQRNANALARGASGSTWLGRRGSELSQIFTGETPAGKIARDVANLESEQSLIKGITDRVTGEMTKSTATHGAFGNLGGSYNYKGVKAAMDAAIARGASSFDITDTSGATRSVSMEDAYANIGGLLKSNEEDYLARANVSGSGITDSKLASLQENARNGGVSVDVTNRGALKNRSDEIDVRKVSMKRAQATAQANDRYSAKK